MWFQLTVREINCRKNYESINRDVNIKRISTTLSLCTEQGSTGLSKMFYLNSGTEKI